MRIKWKRKRFLFKLWRQWRCCVNIVVFKHTFSECDKCYLITPSIPPPPRTNFPPHESWLRKNALDKLFIDFCFHHSCDSIKCADEEAETGGLGRQSKPLISRFQWLSTQFNYWELCVKKEIFQVFVYANLEIFRCWLKLFKL